MFQTKNADAHASSLITAEKIEEFSAEVSRLEQARATLGDDSSRHHVDRLHEQLRHAQEELVTQLEQVSQANVVLESERARYRDLFDRAPDAHFVTDRMGVIYEVNDAAVKLLGKPPSYLRGKPLSVYVTRETVEEYRLAVGRVASGSLVEARVRLSATGPSGAAPWVRLRGWLTNNTHRVLWVATSEVSSPVELKRAAAAVAAAASVLAPSVQTEVSPPAEEEDAAPPSHMERVLAAVSQELRGPLHVVLGWTNLLRQGRVPAKQRERALEVIERSVMMQAAMLEGLLDVSRLTAHGLDLELAPIDLATLLHFAADAAAPLADQAGIALRVEVDALTFVRGDSVRLTQVVMNLVSNALKFTPPGGHVTVRLRAKDGLAVLSVIDSGDGIRQGALENIFECFAQDCEGSKAKAGMGLGLFLVRKLVELHGGTVSAMSDGLGRGATFVVTLPIAAAASVGTLAPVVPARSASND